MSNHWKQQGIPHKGWSLIDVIDVRDDGQDEWETDYETCMMCGNEKIRYVHIVTHPQVIDQFRVGCTCAEKMTNDYINPGQKERELKNRAGRRTNWIKREWKRTKTGNFYLNIDNKFVLIYLDTKTKMYKVKIGNTFGKRAFSNLQHAKIAVFKGIEYLKNEGKW